MRSASFHTLLVVLLAGCQRNSRAESADQPHTDVDSDSDSDADTDRRDTAIDTDTGPPSDVDVLFWRAVDNAGLGTTVWVGDADGDGLMELVTGAPSADLLPNAGTAWVVRAFDRSGPIDAIAETQFTDTDPDRWFGRFVTAGEGTIFVASEAADDVVVRGYRADSLEMVPAAGASVSVVAPLAGRVAMPVDIAFGASIGGEPSLVVSGFGYDDTSPRGIWILRGPFEGALPLADAATVLRGGSEFLGVSARSAGDLDADGWTDLLVASRSATAVQLVLLVTDPPSGLVTAPEIATAEVSLGEAGTDAARGLCAADVTGDGVPDVIAGKPRDASLVYVLAGPISGAIDAPTMARTMLIGQETGLLGRSCATGDLDADGQIDLVVGAPNSLGGGTEVGSVLVFRGPIDPGEVLDSAADAHLHGIGPGDAFGYDVAVGDLDADGRADIAVGAIGASEGASMGGAVAIVFGRSISW